LIWAAILPRSASLKVIEPWRATFGGAVPLVPLSPLLLHPAALTTTAATAAAATTRVDLLIIPTPSEDGAEGVRIYERYLHFALAR
jgi:hypothetical protein